MFDLKVLNSALTQLETERGIPRAKILEAVEDALAAAYKKDYGKKGQMIRAHFDQATGATEFYQVKVAVDESTVRMDLPEEEAEEAPKRSFFKKDGPGMPAHTNVSTDLSKDAEGTTADETAEEDQRPRYNPEHHILLEEARLIKKDAQLGDELIFPLETKSDYGRIAAQTAKQVIIQRIREAERVSVMDEFDKRRGEIVNGTIQRIERGSIFVDLGRVIGQIARDEQIPGEHYRQGERIRAYLFAVEESPRDVTLRLSRSHPQFLHKLFEIEAPEAANGVVEIKAIAREPGTRSKIAVMSHDPHIDPVGSLVGQRGVRVSTVMSELGGEKIDIIEWSDDTAHFIEAALSPAKTEKVTLHEAEKRATIEVAPDQYSLAIGKAGQNARLAAKLTGWKIDIRERGHEEKTKEVAEPEETPEE